MTPRTPLNQATDLVVFHAVDHVAQLFQPHRRLPLRQATISGRYAAALVNCPLDCTVNACFSPYSLPVGRFTLLWPNGALHFVDADAVRRQRVGIELHAHGVFLRAEHLHARYAADHRNALRRAEFRAYSSTV